LNDTEYSQVRKSAHITMAGKRCLLDQ